MLSTVILHLQAVQLRQLLHLYKKRIMKTSLIPFLMLLLPFSSKAQVLQNRYPKTITVAGSAEQEIIPDEINVKVDLREYEKKGQGKVSINKIKAEF